MTKKTTKKATVKKASKKAATKKSTKKVVARAKAGAVDKKKVAAKAKVTRAPKLKGSPNKTAKPKSGLEEVRTLLETATALAKKGKKTAAIKMFKSVASRAKDFPRKAWRARQALAKLGVKIEVANPMVRSEKPKPTTAASATKTAKAAASRELKKEEKVEIESLMGEKEQKVVSILKKVGDKAQWFPVQEVFQVRSKKNTDTQKFRAAVVDELSKVDLVGRIVEGRSHAGGVNELLVRVV